MRRAPPPHVRPRLTTLTMSRGPHRAALLAEHQRSRALFDQRRRLPRRKVPRRSAADIFRGLPPVTQGPSANGPWTQDDDAHATPTARPCPVEQLAACVQRLTVVPSEAGGTTDTCQHFQCHAEIWACCVVRTCQRALCARHHGQSRCHEHGASPHTCPCLTCRPRQPLARLPGDSRIPPPNRGSEERRKRSLSSQRRSADVRRTRRATRDNACLIRALRALGVPVPLVAPGPFWALADGNAMLAPFHRHLAPWGDHVLQPG